MQILSGGVNWPALAASISAGVAALAGIGATLWQASRNWHYEDKRAKISEKRHIYAECLAALKICFNAAVRKDFLQKRLKRNTAAIREYGNALVAAEMAVSALILVASNDVGRLAAEVLDKLRNYSYKEQASLHAAITNLATAMRIEVGESAPTS